MKMRRHDRAVTSPARISGLLDCADTASVAFIYEGAPAVVPLNFGYELVDGRFVFYFHGASLGRKVDAWRKDPRVEIAIVCRAEMAAAEPACRSTCRYASVIANGNMEIIESIEDKLHGLDVLMNNAGAAGPHDYAGTLEHTAVFRMVAVEITGKTNIPEEL